MTSSDRQQSTVAGRRLPDPGTARPPERLAHIVFRTNDLPRMRDWYCTVLAAHPVFGDDRILFLTYDDEHHRVALIATEPYPVPTDEPRVGFYHSAFTYPDLGTLLATYRRLRAAGISPVRAIRHGPTVSLYYRDPDGNHVELQVDSFATADEATEWMSGPVFSANPIGTLFDPEEMIADYERGVPVADLVRRDDDRAPAS
jgi:catechol 2,3-dioxygenase-like lactoylglutathione lyase family enzyme